MKRPDHYNENGVPVFTAESMFRPGENVYIHMSGDLQEFVGILHKHTFLEIVYVISGNAVHETASGSYPVSRGDVIVVNYDTPHAFHEQPSDESFQAYDLMFTPDFLDTSLISARDFSDMCSSVLFYSLFPNQQTIGPDLHLAGSSYSVFGELFNQIYLEFSGRQKGYLALVRAYVTELIIQLFRKLDSSAEGKISPRQKMAVTDTVTYLRENYQNHITLEELALQVFLSKDYLNRIFKETTGLPVNAFLQKLRVEESCRLLTSTDLSVIEIAAACGFGDSKAFYSAFKRQTGLTPGQYRTRSKRDSSIQP